MAKYASCYGFELSIHKDSGDAAWAGKALPVKSAGTERLHKNLRGMYLRLSTRGSEDSRETATDARPKRRTSTNSSVYLNGIWVTESFIHVTNTPRSLIAERDRSTLSAHTFSSTTGQHRRNTLPAFPIDLTIWAWSSLEGIDYS